MKKLLISLFCLLSLNSLIYSEENFSTQSSKPPKVIVFDIHDVLITTNVTLFFTGGLCNLFQGLNSVTEKARIIPQIVCGLCDPRIWTNIYFLGKNGNNITESYFNMIKKYNYQLTFKALIHCANNIFIPMPGIENILEQLINRGYRLELFSNMGPRVLENCRTKHPLFNKYFPSSNLINNKPHDGIYSCRKPQLVAYDTAFNELKERNLEIITFSDILFIDDKEKNLKPAQKFGWKTINFKSIQQLEQELKLQGIL